MTLQQHYQRTLQAHGYAPDAAQEAAVSLLDQVRSGLLGRHAAKRRNRWRRLLPGGRDTAPVQGVYLCGDVGRGKTFVMDLFFSSLPFAEKRRYHFHRLMYRVHGQLKSLQGERDPLDLIADNLAREACVLCFDEFFVSDIADAMILGRLLEALFARGVTLVATSNIPPADLYKDGLQRQQFLPAINLIKQHTHVFSLNGNTDYRLRLLEQAEIWHAPLDTQANQNLERYFASIAPDQGSDDRSLEILDRSIPTQRCADGIVWFSFADLCAGPRSQDDYIEIARLFHTVVVSDIPVLDAQAEDAARRFIAMVDEFYDRRVKLIASASAEPPRLYTGRRLRQEMQRTLSRLVEMQSTAYLAQPHRP
ncbi:MAG: cell division protein ZapE [Gammaproteobacteria bacterium]|jgi:cell division protein ZapE|nr:cell division protein ZapE [Gammaproteobacteria bacterium]